jgi:hypothetical protein
VDIEVEQFKTELLHDIGKLYCEPGASSSGYFWMDKSGKQHYISGAVYQV